MLLLASYLETMVTQNAREDKRTATEKLHVLMFYRLGKKKIRKTLGGWQPPLTPPPLYVRGLISKGE